MAKRFIDTNLFNDSWFMDLSPDAKLFYIYLFTNCDNAGIIDLNIRLAEFQTGIIGLANSFETLCKEYGVNRLRFLNESYYFLPKFITNQYPNGLSENVKPQKSVINRLSEFNINKQTLTKGLSNTYISVQEKDIYKEKDKDKYKDKEIKEGLGEKLEIINEILSYYDFTEMRNPDKQTQALAFVNVLTADGKIELFKEQFSAYKNFKKESKELRHGFSGFLGTAENRYLDGGWNARNWSAECVNGKESITESTKNAFANV